ncbi:MAG: polyprenyl diphosphate synthase [bacterium]|nr:polyprenyl diphosphate synthase [bacterium]
MEDIAKIVSECSIKHVAVIMDGNRRWAKSKGLPSAIGHNKGVEALKRTMRACDDFGIKYLTVYAFSTENWKRTPEEVKFLMKLLGSTLKNELKEMYENNVVISFIGDISQLSSNLQEILNNAVNTTKNNTGVHLQIAFNYGARAEIVRAVNKIISDKEKDVTEEIFAKYLYTKDIPDPDILIRTGGEMRISNYLLWQIAYSEFIVREELWPDFDRNTLGDCIKEFRSRNRRWGK